jgi:N utilization substance protein B
MGERRLAREIVVQSLYEMAQSGTDEERALEANLERRGGPPGAVRAYAERLLREVGTRRAEVTAKLTGALQHWALERVGLVERCVLEVGVTEILYFPDVPVAVAIHEAVDIARKFGADESGGFVNGVLDRIARDAGQAPSARAGLLEAEP